MYFISALNTFQMKSGISGDLKFVVLQELNSAFKGHIN